MIAGPGLIVFSRSLGELGTDIFCRSNRLKSKRLAVAGPLKLLAGNWRSVETGSLCQTAIFDAENDGGAEIAALKWMSFNVYAG